MKKYLPIALALAALAGAAVTSVPASAQQSIPGYSSDGAVVAVPNGGQQHQLRARPGSVAPKYDQQPTSGTPGYGPDGAVIDIK